MLELVHGLELIPSAIALEHAAGVRLIAIDTTRIVVACTRSIRAFVQVIIMRVVSIS